MHKPFIALDIETSGLSPWRDQIYMVGLYDGEQYCCIKSAEDLSELLNGRYLGWEILGHRTDFDIKFLLVQGWLSQEHLADRTVHDSRIMGSLVQSRVPKAYLDQYEVNRKEMNKTLPKGQSHREGSALSLKVMAPWYLKVPPFWETPGDHNNEEYNEKDCLYTYRLGLMMRERLVAEGSWDFYLKLLDWQRMLMEMEIKGISIDLEELTKVEDEYTKKRDELKAKLDGLWAEAHEAYRNNQAYEINLQYEAMMMKALEKAKDKQKCILRYQGLKQAALERIEPFNYASSQQMAWLLKEYLGLDITDPEGEESTGKAVLHKLAADGHEDIKTYLEWREADKVLTMYLPTYRELQIDGVIHPNFNLTGTRTGRTSSSGPNLQQVPSKLYRLFKPRSGHKFVQYDLSGIEAALIALYSGDETLYGILDRGESIHDFNSKALFDLTCPVEEVKKNFPKQRQCAKNLGFACFYGAGWKRIQAVFANAGFVISEADAKRKLANLKKTYPKVFAFHKEVTEIFERGETIFNLLGRPITIQPHENCYMVGFNTLIQSSASDLNLEACHRATKLWNETGGPAQPLLVIHDCIMAEAESAWAEYAAQHLEGYMTNFNLISDNGPIQLRVEGGASTSWEK